MTRPSRDVDKKLLAAAKSLVVEKGFASLTVRAASRRAGVNPGMFHYHFKSKKAFQKRILQEIYEDFFLKFSLLVGEGGGPEERLRNALTFLAFFARDHRMVGLSLLEAAAGGDGGAMDFLSRNLGRHLRLLAGLIRENQRQGTLAAWPVPAVVSFMMGALGLPAILLAGLRRAGVRRPYGASLGRVEINVLSDDGIARRVAAVLKGVAP